MKLLAEWLSAHLELVLPFYLYGKLFFISRSEHDGEIWVDIDPDDSTKQIRVTSDKELVDFIRSNVEYCPKSDEMIVFNVKNAVWKALRRLECKK